eukprot:jgi/Psemu1/304111/fgenesh1_kg.135_\
MRPANLPTPPAHIPIAHRSGGNTLTQRTGHAILWQFFLVVVVVVVVAHDARRDETSFTGRHNTTQYDTIRDEQASNRALLVSALPWSLCFSERRQRDERFGNLELQYSIAASDRNCGECLR